MTSRKLPPSASVATEGDGDKLIAPAATRNAAALCDLLCRVAPASGNALELASGTGQHVAEFARVLPDLHWQPSEIAPDRRASIDAYTRALSNVSPAVSLDATARGWHTSFRGQEFIVLINLLHLISWAEVQILVTEASMALNPGGRLVLYGPFMRSGRLTSDGDRRFHDALSQQDPEIGYKDDKDILALLDSCDLDLIEVAEMPANNLAFVAKKRGT